MRLALNLGYHAGRADPAHHLALAREAQRLGYDSVWVAEAYGADAPTSLAWLAAHTSTIGLGSAVMQIPGRTPTMTAMTAAGLDLVSGGRFRLGLGVSGPQVSEGWHGVRFGRPLARTREYVDIVRLALRRETVAYQGKCYELPLPDGPGKALHLSLHPVRERVPVYLGAVGPKSVALAGEIADGWLATFFTPEQVSYLGDTGPDFDIVATVPVVFGSDVAVCADAVRPMAALYVGGMGSRERNFYNDLAVRMGYGDAAREVQQLYLAGRRRAAERAVPLDFIDRTSLLGPPARIAARLRDFAAAGVTTLAVGLFGQSLETALEGLRALHGLYETAAP